MVTTFQQASSALAKSSKPNGAAIGFFHYKVSNWVEELGLAEQSEQFLMTRWIPGRYLELVASRARDPKQRARLREAAAKLMPSAEELARCSSLCIRRTACLWPPWWNNVHQLFQRSSSAVEGRNGQLSLFHHGHHRLTQSKLTALTVIHNYMKLRADGTTAAQLVFDTLDRVLFFR